MSRTRILVLLLVLVILMQIFPERSGRIELAGVIVAAVYAGIWAGTRFLAAHRRRAAAAAQDLADNEEYRLYKQDLDAIRARHEGERDLNDLASLPQEYQDALNALHGRHQAMLERKFGSR